jgi:hypothetical protein
MRNIYKEVTNQILVELKAAGVRPSREQRRAS